MIIVGEPPEAGTSEQDEDMMMLGKTNMVKARVAEMMPFVTIKY
jgi:hypothetical protein